MDSLILNKKANKKVATVTTPDECKELAVQKRLKDVLSTLTTTYGLTAPQIGIDVCAGIFKYDKIELFMMNPKILAKDTPTIFMGESCVTAPELAKTLRFKEITISWLDMSAVTRRAVLYGQEAFVFQHFIDHLNGIFFSDRVHRERPIVREKEKVGRNDKCPCGSGKKYKKCCL